MRIKLEVEANKCSYWNYENHTRTHDCQCCNCASEGNNIDNAKLGVMIGQDRYCTLSCNIYAELVNKLKDVNNTYSINLKPKEEVPRVQLHRGLRANVTMIDECINNIESYTVQDVINNIINNVVKMKEDFVYQQFERHGYSKDEVNSMIKNKRITSVVHGSATDVYVYVDGEALFSIMEYVDGFESKIVCRDCLNMNEVKGVIKNECNHNCYN